MVENITRILIVDDHSVLRDGLRLMLDKEPRFRVVGDASDGESAVRLAAELTPDVVVMDYHLPELDGVAATRRIIADAPDVKIVVLTADMNAHATTRFMGVGASGYVLKSFAFEELKAAIKAVTHGGTYLSRRVTGTLFSAGSVGQMPTRMKLSPRELEVLKLVAEGRSTKQAAMDLNVSVKTIETHRRNMMEKLQVDNVADLTRFAIREGISSL